MEVLEENFLVNMNPKGVEYSMGKKEQAMKIAEMLKRDSERYGIPIKVKEDKQKKKK